jgi:hypothetical protein
MTKEISDADLELKLDFSNAVRGDLGERFLFKLGKF